MLERNMLNESKRLNVLNRGFVLGRCHLEATETCIHALCAFARCTTLTMKYKPLAKHRFGNILRMYFILLI